MINRTFKPIVTSSGGVLKSPDYQGRLSVSKVLTDPRIVHYLLEGKYGMGKRAAILEEITRNPSKFTRFITKIRQGDYGTDIQGNFGKAVLVNKRTKKQIPNYEKMSAKELMEEIFG